MKFNQTGSYVTAAFINIYKVTRHIDVLSFKAGIRLCVVSLGFLIFTDTALP